jgi:hypothetical protein
MLYSPRMPMGFSCRLSGLGSFESLRIKIQVFRSTNRIKYVLVDVALQGDTEL